MALKDDQINAVLNINGSPARAGMLELSESTQKLTKRNRELDIIMKRLEATNQKGTKLWQLYDEELQQNKKTIKENKEEHKNLQSQLKTNEKTMSELKREATSLRAQLNNTVPKTEKWEELNQKYKETVKRMQQVSDANKNLCSQINTTIGVVIGNLFTSLLKGIVSGIKSVLNEGEQAYKSFMESQAKLTQVMKIR